VGDDRGQKAASLSAKFDFPPIPIRSPQQQHQRQHCEMTMLLLQLLQWRKSINNSFSSGRSRLTFAFFNRTKPAELRRYQPNSTSLQSQFNRRSNINQIRLPSNPNLIVYLPAFFKALML
jgi:hypothetical protein